MANSPQARKRIRQAEKRRQHNASYRSMFRTAVKKVLKAIATGDKAAAEAAFKDAQPLMDRTAQKGLVHANKTARQKSHISKHIKEMQG